MFKENVMKPKSMKTLFTLISVTSFLFATDCPKVVIIAPEFSEQQLGIEYRGKEYSYASPAIAKAVAANYEGSKILTEAEFQVLSSTCKPEKLIRLRLSSYTLEPKFKTTRYAIMNIEETFFESPDLTKLVKTVNQEVTGPKWFGVNLPLKWAVRYFVKETAKESSTATTSVSK